MLTTKIIELEMSAQPKRGFTEVKQNDADGVQLKLILRNSDYTAYLIPDGAVVSFLAVKSDKKSVVLSSTDDNPRVTYTANSNIVLVTLPAQVLAVAGFILCNITISKDGATTSTQTFTLSCAEALTADDLTSSSEFQSLSKMLADLTARKAEFDAINDKIANMALGYGGTFATLAALQADANANTPDGKKRFYIVAADGHHYYWSNINSAWTDGGTIIPYADVTALKDGIVNTNKRLGYGVRNNGLKVTPTEPASNMVNISGDTFDMPDGRYFEISSTSINVNANNTSLPRTDIIYVSKYGALSYLAGTVNIVAGQRTYTLTTNFGALDNVSVCGISVFAGTDFDYEDGISAAISNLANLLNTIPAFKSIYTASASGNVLTITEKVAGGGNTPTIMTIVGTGVVVNGTAIVSTATSTPAALPEGGELLYQITMPAGATTVLSSYLIDKRPISILYSTTNNETYNDTGKRIKATEEKVKDLQERTYAAELNINTLQTTAEQHDTELDTLKVYTAKLESELAALRAAQAQMSGDTRINLNSTGKITAVPKNAAVLGVGGTIKGMTLTPLVAQSNVPIGSSVTFNSVSGNKYYDGLHKTILTGTGSTMTVTNDTTAVANINVIDLTAHGLQNKTAAEILQICPNYISGIQSAVPMRLKSINGNYFDGIWESGYYNITTGAKASLSTAIRNKNKIPVPAGAIYISGLPSTGDKYALKYDVNGNYIGNSYLNGNGYTVGSLTMPNAGYICFYATNTTAFPTQTQVELGTTATPYKARQESSCYIEPKPLRRLPNGVCDTVDLVTGKRTINVKEYVLQESDITAYNEGTNVAQVVIKKPSDSYALSSNTYNNGHSILEGYGYRAAYGGVFDNTQNIGCLLSDTSSTMYVLVVAKGTYSNLTAARTALAGKKLIYQLATPITENNVVTGTLLSYPKGLIICEPVIADAGVYDDGITILRTDYPIQSLETLCKFNADGTQSPLDVSAATITDAGTKITHPGISNGDIVAFTYFTASSGIIGENVFNYVNANGLTLGADGKYYKVGFAIDASGNISLTKTEVV